MSETIACSAVRFVKELYPRVREDDAAIERYRAAIDRLPPIVIARDGVLVDGFHRWQAYRRENVETIPVENLGNLSDIEIVKESIRRNATHGRQLDTSDKRRMADQLYRQGVRDASELSELLAITSSTLETYLRDAKRDEKQAQKDKAWDLWLDCTSYRQAGETLGVDHKTIEKWCGEKADESGNSPPASRQHFDIWQFPKAEANSSYFGRMPPQVVENLLWFFTQPGQIVFDPFAGGGTTIEVAKAMGRRVWASDRKPSTPTLPIHEHNILDGWPSDAPSKADLIILDPPYWKQAAGKYSDSPDDLGNMSADDFLHAWAQVIKVCSSHLAADGCIAYIISPTQCDDGRVVDHATEMLATCWNADLIIRRRIIVPYQTQQATGQQVEWARDNKRLLKLYRDLVVMTAR